MMRSIEAFKLATRDNQRRIITTKMSGGHTWKLYGLHEVIEDELWEHGEPVVMLEQSQLRLRLIWSC